MRIKDLAFYLGLVILLIIIENFSNPTYVLAQQCGSTVTCGKCVDFNPDGSCNLMAYAAAPCSPGGGADGCDDVDPDCCANCNYDGYIYDSGQCNLSGGGGSPSPGFTPPPGPGCAAYDIDYVNHTWKCGGSCQAGRVEVFLRVLLLLLPVYRTCR